MLQKMLREPVVASLAAKMLALLAASYGVEVSYETLMEVSIGLDVLIAAYVRWQSTPNAKVKEKVEKMLSVPPAALVLFSMLPILSLMPACATVPVEREACYAKAHADLWEAAEAQCGPTGDDWKRCKHRLRLLAEHRVAQRSCP